MKTYIVEPMSMLGQTYVSALYLSAQCVFLVYPSGMICLPFHSLSFRFSFGSNHGI
jgi:hypothetical protein